MAENLQIVKGTVRRVAHAREVRRQRRTGVQFKPWMANGNPYVGLSDKLKYGIAVGVVHFKLTVTSTYEGYPGDGVHSPTSWHYKRRAVDIASWSRRQMVRFQRYLVNHHTRALEIFGPANSWFVKNGIQYTAADNTSLENAHDTHVHWAQ